MAGKNKFEENIEKLEKQIIESARDDTNKALTENELKYLKVVIEDNKKLMQHIEKGNQANLRQVTMAAVSFINTYNNYKHIVDNYKKELNKKNIATRRQSLKGERDINKIIAQAQHTIRYNRIAPLYQLLYSSAFRFILSLRSFYDGSITKIEYATLIIDENGERKIETRIFPLSAVIDKITYESRASLASLEGGSPAVIDDLSGFENALFEIAEIYTQFTKNSRINVDDKGFSKDEEGNISFSGRRKEIGVFKRQRQNFKIRYNNTDYDIKNLGVIFEAIIANRYGVEKSVTNRLNKGKEESAALHEDIEFITPPDGQIHRIAIKSGNFSLPRLPGYYKLATEVIDIIKQNKNQNIENSEVVLKQMLDNQIKVATKV